MIIKDLKIELSSVALLTAALFFCFLAVNAYSAFGYKRSYSNLTSSDFQADVSSPSILISQKEILKNQINEQVAALSKPLEFMVWPMERKNVSRELLATLHQQINQEPFNAIAWRKLSYAEYDLELPVSDRVWAINVGSKLNWWKVSERLLLTRHCLVEFEAFNKDSSNRCGDLIDNLPQHLSNRKLAIGMGIKVKYLEWLLLKEGLKMKGKQQDRIKK